jgi:hypothetical protein
LQETKLDACDVTLVAGLCGARFDFCDLPASNSSGGILLAWDRDLWSVANFIKGRFSLTAKVTLTANAQSWWLTCVYGPRLDAEKALFLEELRQLRLGCSGMWMICGDFNLIYKAEDKNNTRLNRHMMNSFRRLLEDLALLELYLHGRLYTWSNERKLRLWNGSTGPLSWTTELAHSRTTNFLP